MKRKKLSEKHFADPRGIAEPVCFAEPEHIAVRGYFSRYLRHRWGLEEPKKPTKSWDIDDYLNDVPYDWKGYRIPKMNEEEYRRKCELINFLTGVNPTQPKGSQLRIPERCVKQLPKDNPEKGQQDNQIKHRFSKSKNKKKRKKKHLSTNGKHSDDFEVNRQDRKEIHRKIFEEKFWKSQIQKRYAGELQSPMCVQQTHHAYSADPRLQRRASMTQTHDSAASSPFLAVAVPRGPREREATGGARRELFTAAEPAKQRREREYEERIQKEFERNKRERGGSNNKPHTWFYSENKEIIKDV